MNKIISPKIVVLTFGILVVSFLTAFYVVAWQEPSQAPPAGNVPSPGPVVDRVTRTTNVSSPPSAPVWSPVLSASITVSNYSRNIFIFASAHSMGSLGRTFGRLRILRDAVVLKEWDIASSITNGVQEWHPLNIVTLDPLVAPGNYTYKLEIITTGDNDEFKIRASSGNPIELTIIQF